MKHYIIVKFKKDFDKQNALKPIKILFNKALDIEGVEQVSVIPSNSTRQNRYDLMIEMQMTPDGLEAYDISEMHKEWKQEYGSYIEAKAIFDCD